ncbi:KIF-binding protein-like [Mercenaria mercenaria]|uniref:KIF-binding protein-like n=1 Tax=Mercenaria mercenaria TaxID=6596 RepID=UPI00234F8AAA|nr:KIF-binding protein-like [Mercenaria mercenaria]
MAAWKDFLLREGYENLSEAKKYAEELSNDDPEDEPYRSLYKARENYKTVKKVLKKFADKRHADEDLQFLWAALELKLGINYTSTEEQGTGEEHLQKCLEKMEDFKLTLKGTGIYLEALNNMGILLTGRRKPDEALEYFKQAELLYIDFKNVIGGAPWMVDEFLSPPRDDMDKLEFERATHLESTYTHTLFYFAQVYQHLGQADVSAQYCHFTLQRQLDSHNLDSLDWSLQAATLSQYYMTERDFTMSRHCLASAEVIFEQAEANNVNCPDEMKEKINQAKADIQRCWIKYGLGLLEYSKEKQLEELASQSEGEEGETDKRSGSAASGTQSNASTSTSGQATSNADSSQNEGSVSSTSTPRNVENDQIKQDDSEASQPEDNSNAESQNTEATGTNENEGESQNVAESNQNVEKSVLDSEQRRKIEREKQVHERFNLEVTSHEEKVTDKPLPNFEEARVVFLLIKKWIEGAKEFYKFDYHCPDYVSIVQDHSLSFKFLSYFEPDLERQCKMHKRRIDMLSEVLKELSIQHYLLVCRQLMFEIADTYSAMYDLKLAIMEASGEGSRPTPHHVKKLNSLTSESIKYYQDYLNTLKGGKPVYPDEFPVNDVRPGLVAMFCMGRLFSKFLTGDVQTRLLNIKKSKDCYQFIVDYCKRNPSAATLVESELDICKEMVQLLPAKMEKIRLQSEI